jgi:hypothetical protein
MNLGSPAENRTARILESFGYLVASRRHVGGAGDLVAILLGDTVEVRNRLEPLPPITRGLLVEVKRGTGNPWENFRHGDRIAMVEAGFLYRLTPLLAYWPWSPSANKHPIWLEQSDWPQQ